MVIGQIFCMPGLLSKGSLYFQAVNQAIIQAYLLLVILVNTMCKFIKHINESKKDMRMKRIPLKQLIISIAIGASFLTHTAFSAVMPVYERLEPINDHLSYPTAIALDHYENMYVTESIENRLQIFSQSGSYVKTLSGLGEPLGVAVDQQGRIFVGNKLGRNVEVYDSDLHFLFKLGSGNGEFSQPTAIAIYEDRIYVADSLQDVIKVYHPDGSFNFSIGRKGNDAGQFNFPVSLAVNEISGELIVLDRQHIESWTGVGQGARIQIFDMDGLFKRSFGEHGIGEGKLSKPVGVTVDSEGRIYVTDTYQQLVQVFDGNGTFLNSLYNADHQFRTPIGIIRGESNRLFMASLHTGSVEIFGIDSYTHLTVEPLFLFFEGDEEGNNPELQSIEIGNEGNSPLNWTAYSENSWINLAENSGALEPAEKHTLEITADMNGLTAGIYTGIVEVSAESGATEIVEVILNVVLPPVPELSVHPLSLEFVSVNGSTPASQSLSIANAGMGVLTWTASSNVDWMSLDTTAGTAPDIVSVSVNASDLKEGVFTGSLTITGEGAVSSPRIIPVIFDVSEAKGQISVNSNIDSATFVINGSGTYSGSGKKWDVKNAPAGTYYIQFNSVQGYITPSYQSQTLEAKGKITFHGEYIKTVVQEEEQEGEKEYVNIITGAGSMEANTGRVKVYDPDGMESGVAFQAHENGFGVNVAAGDINNDGIDEIITAPGPGPENPAEIRIFDHTGRPFDQLTTMVFPYLYGANIASGDINCDGYDEVIVGTGIYEGNPSEVRVFVHDPEQEKLVDSGIHLNAFESGGGVLVASGDMDCDKQDEIITASAPDNGNKIQIRIWKVDTSAGIGHWSVSLAKEFSMKARTMDGFSITGSDINGDGFTEIVTGSRSNSGSNSMINVFDAEGAEISEFQVGESSHYITSVASADMDGDGAAEIVVGTVYDAIRTENMTFNDAKTEHDVYLEVGSLMEEIVVGMVLSNLQTTAVTVYDAFGSEKMTFTGPKAQHGVNLAVGRFFLEE